MPRKKEPAAAAPTPAIAGPVALTVADPQPGPAQERQIERGKTIADSLGIVEQIGLVNAVAGLKDGLNKLAKQECLDNSAQKIESPHFVGIVAGGGERVTIDIARYLELCRRKKVDPAKVNATLKVLKEGITFLSDDELASVSDPMPPAPLSFTVSARRDVPGLEIQEALRTFAQQAIDGKIMLPAPSGKRK